MTFRRYVEPGNPRPPGKGVRNETYGAVEAALFRREGRATLLAERPELPDLTGSIPRTARVEAVSVSPTLAVRIPPYSLTRLIWNSC